MGGVVRVEGRRTPASRREVCDLLLRKDAHAMVARTHAEYCKDEEENDRVTRGSRERRPMERRFSEAAIPGARRVLHLTEETPRSGGA